MVSVAVATATPTPTARHRRVRRGIPASTPRAERWGAFVRNGHGPGCAVKNVLTLGCLMRASCGQWSTRRDERCLTGANGGYGLLPIGYLSSGWRDERACIDDKRVQP